MNSKFICSLLSDIELFCVQEKNENIVHMFKVTFETLIQSVQKETENLLIYLHFTFFRFIKKFHLQLICCSRMAIECF